MSGAGTQHPKHGVGEAGASLVEFALLAPLLFAILLGTITGGLALSKKNSVTNAVREGGRLGATLYSDDSSWTWEDWAHDVRGRVVVLAGSDLNDSEVCVQLVDTKATSIPADDTVVGEYPATGCPAAPMMPDPPPTPASADGCIVKVWARTEADFNAVFFSRVLTLDGSAVGLYERPKCP